MKQADAAHALSLYNAISEIDRNIRFVKAGIGMKVLLCGADDRNQRNTFVEFSSSPLLCTLQRTVLEELKRERALRTEGLLRLGFEISEPAT
jgi:hypothetical protein